MSTRTNRPSSLTAPPLAQHIGLPVPLRLTHKRRPAAQLVQRWWRTEMHRFAVTAEWSAEHPHYLPAGDGGPGLPLVAETLRQAVISVCHAAYDVPQDHAFVMKALSVELDTATPALASVREVRVDLTCHDVVVARGELRSMEISLEFLHEGRRFACGTGSLTLLPAAVYERLRCTVTPVSHRTTGACVAAARVGRTVEADVLLVEAPGGEHRLLVDTDHPWHFDHPADHLPGMLFVEAAVQAHHSCSGGAEPRVLSATFDKYAEVAPDVALDVRHHDDGTAVRFVQNGDVVASATVSRT